MANGSIELLSWEQYQISRQQFIRITTDKSVHDVSKKTDYNKLLRQVLPKRCVKKVEILTNAEA
ncbi:hypothetical protein C4564_00185 [Candidatus Microgenomates bacterium]|nr:MAG: hypothetical protein C4564_00185 [Candidatus Microgenomates bacterium]